MAMRLVLVALFAYFVPPSCGAEAVFPGEKWQNASPSDVGLDVQKLNEARDYALTGGGSGCIVRHGRLVMTWGDQQRRYDLKSTTKSIGVTALGLAIMDGKMRLNDLAKRHHPSLDQSPSENAKTGWLDEITLLHLATQTAGFEKPGGYTPLLFQPGTKWDYSDSGPNWLAECVTLAYRRDLHELLNERIFRPIGIGRRDLTWRNNQYRPHDIEGIKRREMGSGISANVNAMARIGLLYLNEGKWKGEQLLEADFVRRARAPIDSVVGLPEYDPTKHGNASDHYGLLWWNNADGALANVPRDAFWSWGLYDSLIVVIPSLDLVAARAGKSWRRQSGEHYDVLASFLTPLAEAADQSHGKGVIQDIEWAPASTIVRLAKGSDNWPITWADDGLQYTAYGDGWGFTPRMPKKLSLGFASVAGDPENIVAKNIPSQSGEQTGDGASGKKASGMLSIDGVLYMLVRNADNSQLAWSTDHAKTWTWADWKFTESFGCPTFVNYGKDYQNALDEYVYIFSQDSDSAYNSADGYVLARAPKGRLQEKGAYEFFVRRNAGGESEWSKDIDERGQVFSKPDACGRSSVTYHKGLKRYLWVQLPGGDTRDKGGLRVCEAVKPWGPWRIAYQTDNWDVGPGETASFPAKWISADGKTAHLVFSGDDCFSVRRATFIIRPMR